LPPFSITVDSQLCTMAQRILVTGGNSGIGLALCKQLVAEKGCFVYLGSRDPAKGAAAVKSIVDAVPGSEGKIESLQIDVASTDSVTAAAVAVKAGGPLYAIVNNAGTGLAHPGVTEEMVLNTNLYGPKRVCESFIPLLSASGRIVNVGSGAGPMWLGKQSVETKKLLTNPDITWEQIETLCKQEASKPKEGMGAYGYSKASLTAYTMVLGKTYPNLGCGCVSPGFIDTGIVKGFGASKPPEEGTVSIHKCLWEELAGNGYYYGSDGVRSPLTWMRNPGEPAYAGEPEV